MLGMSDMKYKAKDKIATKNTVPERKWETLT